MMLSKKRKRSSSGPWLFLLILIGFFIITGIILKNFWSTKLLPVLEPSPQVKAIVNTPYVSTNETSLYLNGQPFKFTGVNAFSLGSVNGVNAGCGGQISEIDNFFASLRPNSVVRTWAFQGGIGTNATTKKVDWTALDRMVNSATSHNQKLILVFTGQAGTCDDGHWKDLSWYSGGYKLAFNDDKRGLAPLPYLDYVKLVVDRYKNSTAIAMWELVSEAESSNCAAGFKGDDCYGHQSCLNEQAATKALRGFFDSVGGAVKAIDKNHIIESGLIGTGQCGAIFEDYSYIHQSPGVDVASYHDYGENNSAMPGDQWNGLQKRLNQLKSIKKPLIVGEVGMLAMSNSSNCLNLSTRRDKIKTKMDAQFKAGVVGYLPWDWTGAASKICNFDIGANDPMMALLHDYQLF